MQTNIINVSKLNKSFGTLHAVKNVDLKVKKGEIFGFLGPNGSGKTTMIRMLCGLLTPDSGTGHCLGYNILTESLKIKMKVGYMTQRFSYYEDLSIIENLKFVARIYQLTKINERIKKIIAEFELGNYQHQLAGSLSGGWKQRMALAACLLHQPDLLLLDEPTAGVDPEARRQFWNKIHELSTYGITTLVSTHYMDEAERCSRLAYIAYGNILEQGTAKEIIEHVGLTTYKISGSQINQLNHWLQSLGDNFQVVMFGETLHISSQNLIELEKILEQIRLQQNYRIEKIETSLEDVFIHLIGIARHDQNR